MYCLLAAKTLYLCGFFASSYITIRTSKNARKPQEYAQSFC